MLGHVDVEGCSGKRRRENKSDLTRQHGVSRRIPRNMPASADFSRC
jgi:hypothetical protein